MFICTQSSVSVTVCVWLATTLLACSMKVAVLPCCKQVFALGS